MIMLLLKQKFLKRKLAILCLLAMSYVLLINLVLLLAGCGRTFNDWKVGFASKAKLPTIYGIVQDETRSGTKGCIVLEYRVFPYRHTWGPDFSKLYVAIAIDHGKAGHPFRYEGPICSGVDLEKVVQGKQLDDVARHVFPSQSMETANAFLKQHEVKEVNQEGTIFSGLEVQESRFYQYEPNGEMISIIPYWFKDPRLNLSPYREGRNFFYDYNYSDLYANPPRLLKPDGILLVPSEQKRPLHDRRRSLLWAVIKTPVDMCVDAFMTPIYFAFFSFYRLTGNVWW